MTADQFKKWLKLMDKAGWLTTNANLAQLIGVTVNTVMAYKRHGCDRKTALACAALIAGLDVGRAYK